MPRWQVGPKRGRISTPLLNSVLSSLVCIIVWTTLHTGVNALLPYTTLSVDGPNVTLNLHKLWGSLNLEQRILRYLGTYGQCSATLMKYSFYYSVDVLYTVVCAFKCMYIFIHIIWKVSPLLFKWMRMCQMILKKRTKVIICSKIRTVLGSEMLDFLEP